MKSDGEIHSVGWMSASPVGRHERCRGMLRAGDVSCASIADELGMAIETVEGIKEELGL